MLVSRIHEQRLAAVDTSNLSSVTAKIKSLFQIYLCDWYRWAIEKYSHGSKSRQIKSTWKEALLQAGPKDLHINGLDNRGKLWSIQ